MKMSHLEAAQVYGIVRCHSLGLQQDCRLHVR